MRFFWVFSPRKCGFLVTCLLMGVTLHAGILATKVADPLTVSSAGILWDTHSVVVAIDPSVTEWIAWNNQPDVVLTHPSRPGETLLGPGGYGIDDYLTITVTNPLGSSLTVNYDQNDGPGNSFGPQNVFYGTSAAAPDALRTSPPWAPSPNVDTFFDEAGQFDSLFTMAGDYTFRFDFMNNFAGPAGRGDVYLLVAIPEPSTWVLVSILMGTGWLFLRKRKSG